MYTTYTRCSVFNVHSLSFDCYPSPMVHTPFFNNKYGIGLGISWQLYNSVFRFIFFKRQKVRGPMVILHGPTGPKVLPCAPFDAFLDIFMDTGHKVHHTMKVGIALSLLFVSVDLAAISVRLLSFKFTHTDFCSDEKFL